MIQINASQRLKAASTHQSNETDMVDGKSGVEVKNHMSVDTLTAPDPITASAKTFRLNAATRLKAAQADVEMAKNYVAQTFGIKPWGPYKNEHGLIEFGVSDDERKTFFANWKKHFGEFPKAKRDKRGDLFLTVDLGGGRSLMMRKDDDTMEYFVSLIDKKAAKGAAAAPGMQLLKEITRLCHMPSPNKNNTEAKRPGWISYSAKHGTDSRDNGADHYLRGLGLTERVNNHGGGSSHGDFSSDFYSSTWTHGRVEISVGSSFRTESRVFVTISGPADELTALEAKK